MASLSQTLATPCRTKQQPSVINKHGKSECLPIRIVNSFGNILHRTSTVMQLLNCTHHCETQLHKNNFYDSSHELCKKRKER